LSDPDLLSPISRPLDQHERARFTLAWQPGAASADLKMLSAAELVERHGALREAWGEVRAGAAGSDRRALRQAR
jgi:hypothetical protein